MFFGISNFLCSKVPEIKKLNLIAFKVSSKLLNLTINFENSSSEIWPISLLYISLILSKTLNKSISKLPFFFNFLILNNSFA